MKLFKKLCLLMLTAAVSISVLCGCSIFYEEVVTEEDAVNIMTEYYEQITKTVTEAGYLLNLKDCKTPQLEELEDGTRRVASVIYFNGIDSLYRVIMYQPLNEKTIDINVSMKTNNDITEDNKASLNMQMVINVINLVSEKQFTLDEYVSFVTNDKYIKKYDEADATLREKTSGNKLLRCLEFMEYDSKLDYYVLTKAKFTYSVSSKSKKGLLIVEGDTL